MDIRKLQRTIVDALEDVKAHHIVVFNTEALSPLFERIVVASGTSNRQTKALAASVREAVKSAGLEVRVEGEDNGEWIIVDCGAAVCHIMQPTIRDYYRLEEIWGVKPVRLKLGGETKLPKASEPAAPAKPARKPATRAAAPAAAKKAPARKAPAKPAAKTGVARKAGAKKAGAVQKVVVHSPRAPKTAKPAAKPAAKKTPTRR
ncbi:MAG: ribosome silencing factor [Proteobacteria bacterium]|nr:ribosome silencing factor [Pseudomonadota bacterium]